MASAVRPGAVAAIIGVGAAAVLALPYRRVHYESFEF